MKIKYQIEEYDPEREYVLVKFTSDENPDHQYYKSLNPMDFSKEKLTELLEAVASVAGGYWNRAENHAVECPIEKEGVVDVEPENYMAQEIFPEILDQPDYDVWLELIEQEDYASPYQETIGWNIIKLSSAEAAAQAEFLEGCMRTDRNQLLLESDWIHQPDSQVGNIDEWNGYRQKLRDLPTASGWPKNIDWPALPELKKV